MAALATSAVAEVRGTVGNSTTCDAAFKASMSGQAMLAVDEEHIFATIAKGLLPEPAGGRVLIPYRLIVYLTYDHLVFAPAVLDRHMLWYIKTARWSQLCRDLANAGFDASPAESSIAARVSLNAAIAALPEAQRLISLANTVLVAPPATATWMVGATGRRANGIQQTNRPISEFVRLVADCFVENNHGGDFEAALELLVPASAENAKDGAKAIKTLAHVTSSNPDASFDVWVEDAEMLAELERRSQPTQDERFLLLFGR